jgi:AcrR family transcriptional regulator
MSTNGETREFILEQSSELASRVGLTALSISSVARHLDRSKSTVFFHFGSKEALQLAVLQNAARELLRDVIRPAFMEPVGLPRLARLVDRWMVWDGWGCYSGGCLFVAIISEFDDQPGPVRDRLVQLYNIWCHVLENLVRATIATGTFRPDTDCEQFLQDLQGILLGFHLTTRLARDSGAERRAWLGFWRLVQEAGAG